MPGVQHPHYVMVEKYLFNSSVTRVVAKVTEFPFELF